jgi:hypothetical protein
LPRKPLSDDVVQVSVRLPRKLLNQLEAVAGQGRVSSEIRERVEASLRSPGMAAVDPKTTELIRRLSVACLAIEEAYGPWWRDGFPSRVLIRVMGLLVARLSEGTWGKPDEEESFRAPAPGSTLDNLMGNQTLKPEHSIEGLAAIVAVVAEMSNLMTGERRQ